jgi:hypothetical protein
MEGCCSIGQGPQRAVVPMEEEEEEDDDYDDDEEGEEEEVEFRGSFVTQIKMFSF